MDSFDPLACARLCAEAYGAPPDLVAGDVKVIRRAAGATTIYAFRGSVDGADWAIDLDSLPWHDGDLGCPVHRGFGCDLTEIWPVIAADPAARTGTVVLTGHSKGGATAILVAARLVVDGRPPAALITFGAPRVAVGGRLGTLLDGVPQSHYRHGRDIVPTVPPGAWWRHPAPLIGIGQPGNPVTDHCIAGYVGALDPTNPAHPAALAIPA